MAILVAADFGIDDWDAWWPHLQAALPCETLVRAPHAVPAGEIDIALVANPPLGSLQGLSNLRLIQSLWAGVDRLLADVTVPPGVPLARMVDPQMNDAMAQTAAWAVLSLQRGFFEYAAQQRRSVWAPRPWRRADEFTVAVLGLGQMGRAAAQRLAALGHPVLGWQRHDAVAAVSGIECSAGEAALESVLARADAVINLLPLTDATRGVFAARTFAQMRRGASLVNLARGAHVVEADLLAALDRGHLDRAVLDVFATEPLPTGHPFWSHPAVTVLPHVAAPTDARSAAPIAARNVFALRSGAPLQHLVDRTRGY
jgi:glyoxylate/hydroxypyruvate reductase